jgi:SAM-dependent methyltransferase
MDKQRNLLTGVGNIIRFNWGFYAAGLGMVIIFLAAGFLADGFLKPLLYVLGGFGFMPLLISTMVSWYVYDLSGFYHLTWMSLPPQNLSGTLLNIHAGFDETSSLLTAKFPQATLKVYDFYDPVKHTEISIERARKAYLAYQGTLKITTESIPDANDAVDAIFLIFAAHEIRDNGERNRLFIELKRILKKDGTIHIVEHLRDLPNFIAYTIGFFHFLPKSAWNETFASSGFAVKSTSSINPFVKYFILQKNDTTSY